MSKSIDPMGGRTRRDTALEPHPAPIVSMSLRPGIPWRVALPQSPPPLPRLRTSMQQSAGKANPFPANRNLSLIYWSHQTTALHPVPDLPPDLPPHKSVQAGSVPQVRWLSPISAISAVTDLRRSPPAISTCADGATGYAAGAGNPRHSAITDGLALGGGHQASHALVQEGCQRTESPLNVVVVGHHKQYKRKPPKLVTFIF